MNALMKIRRLVLLLWTVCLLAPAFSSAEPGILAYPSSNAIFQYDPLKYILIYPGDSLYDPAYDRFGVVLWDTENNRIAYELYQAPGLLGFEPAYIEKNSFKLPSNRLILNVDGFYHLPRRLNDIIVRFLPTPGNAEPVIYADDTKVEGLKYYIPSLEVSTPTGNGYYSDKVTLNIVWSGAQSIKISVFCDKNGNGLFEGTESFSVFMQDQTIPVTNSTWGGIKAQYQ